MKIFNTMIKMVLFFGLIIMTGTTNGAFGNESTVLPGSVQVELPRQGTGDVIFGVYNTFSDTCTRYVNTVIDLDSNENTVRIQQSVEYLTDIMCLMMLVHIRIEKSLEITRAGFYKVMAMDENGNEHQMGSFELKAP